MDILAHALWAGAGAELLRRHSYMTSSEARAIVLLAVLPDVLQSVPIVGWAILGDGSIKAVYEYAIATPGTEPALPPMVKILVHHLHCIGQIV